jgi:hypothetical protein
MNCEDLRDANESGDLRIIKSTSSQSWTSQPSLCSHFNSAALFCVRFYWNWEIFVLLFLRNCFNGISWF